MGDFVVGDKIKGKDNNYDVTNKDMTLAEVTKTYDDGEMDIYIINHANEREEGSTYSVDNNADKFELVEENDLSYNFKLTSELEDEWERLVKNGMVAIHPDLGDDVEKWFQGQSTVNFIDEDSLDAWRYALADFKTIDKYIKNEEENEMKNEVLELWFKRKGNDIEKKYDELESKYIDEKHSVVKSYEDMIEDFERQLEDLYKYDNASEQFVLKENNGCNVFKYVLDEDKLVEEAEQFYKEDKKKEMQEVLKDYNEIKALLSMSEDLEYQQSILIEYKIIDKKTKRMI